MTPRERIIGLLLVALAVAGCAATGPSVGDTERVWCGSHPAAVVTAGTSLGIGPSDLVKFKAAINQAEVDGDEDLVASLILQRVSSMMESSSAAPDRTQI